MVNVMAVFTVQVAQTADCCGFQPSTTVRTGDSEARFRHPADMDPPGQLYWLAFVSHFRKLHTLSVTVTVYMRFVLLRIECWYNNPYGSIYFWSRVFWLLHY